MWNTKSICLFLLGFIGVGTVEGQTSVDSYEYSSYVDPRIGSEGLGRVFIGPSCPYGMVKPSPDCTPSPNSGWLPMPERVDGFAQVHVSGTGGGPKYGNVLVTPFGDGMDWVNHYDYREYETFGWDIMTRRLSRTAFVRKSLLPIVLLSIVLLIRKIL